jgi:hypothetical protein
MYRLPYKTIHYDIAEEVYVIFSFFISKIYFILLFLW